MNIEVFRDYCLAKKGVEETFPFGDDTLVFKVMGKMFALTGLDEIDYSVNLKCDPDWAIELRETHPDDIAPGYHMNKKYWNTVQFERNLDDAFLIKLIDHSYDLVLASLPKKIRTEWSALPG